MMVRIDLKLTEVALIVEALKVFRDVEPGDFELVTSLNNLAAYLLGEAEII